jgi:hypothetical protein
MNATGSHGSPVMSKFPVEPGMPTPPTTTPTLERHV